MEPGSRGPAESSDWEEDAGIEIQVADLGWRRMVRGVDRVARRAAQAAGARLVVLTSDAEVRRLNAQYRGRDKPTNVLTFETGDIILARGVVAREARREGKTVAHHLSHLIVHGALHLDGHDHHHPGDARRMEMAEARILSRLRVPNPWKRT